MSVIVSLRLSLHTSFFWTCLSVQAIELKSLDRASHRSLQSFSCPYLSRHVEIWDEVPFGGGFKTRFGDKLQQELPDGCTALGATNPDSETSFLEMAVRKISLRELEHRSNQLPIIPYPRSIKSLNATGPFVLTKGTTITLGPGVSEDDIAVAALRQHIAEIANRSQDDSDLVPTIYLSIVDAKDADPESYKISVSNNDINVQAPALAGLFYGAETLHQLLASAFTNDGENSHLNLNLGSIPEMVIEDAPSFKWRGLHLDVSRHFFSANDVKKLLSTMAMFKLNRFHWHLTDDQGWRFPVPEYPELTRKAAGPRYKGKVMIDSGEGFEGAYTEEDIRDVLAHAKAKRIIVIPEVDVPGHVAAAVSAYPELGNQDFESPAGPQHDFGVHHWTLAPTNKSSAFLEAVFKQIARLFPDAPYIHLGGDEAPQDQWRQSSQAAKSQWEHFEGSNPQSYFNRRVSEIIKANGKKMAGWDEVQGMDGLPDDALIFAWRGENELRKAIQSGRQAVNAENGHLYLDHYQGSERDEPKAIGGPLTTVRDVYMYEPLPAWVDDSEKHLVLGGQAQLWSEYFPNWQQVEYMAWPRAIALAERLWTPHEEASFPDFECRLKKRENDLRRWGTHYHPFTS